MSQKAGIASMGVSLPPLYISVEELAKLRGVDPNKFTQGLGCKEIALCPPDYNVAERWRVMVVISLIYEFLLN